MPAHRIPDFEVESTIERSTFVIGADGSLVNEWRGVKVAGHAEEVLAQVRSL